MSKKTVNGIEYIDTPELLKTIQEWLTDGKPFFHTRYNDGELFSMFNLRGPHKSTGEHHYSVEVGQALMQTFKDLMSNLVNKTEMSQRILLGSWWYVDPTHEAAAPIKHWIESNLTPEIQKTIPWTASDLWHNVTLEEAGLCLKNELLDLFSSIRTIDRKVVLVGNSQIANAHYYLNSQFVEIPKTDAFNSDQEIYQRLRELASDENTLFVWCGGFPAKVWSWRIWKEFPNTCHIDAGCIFDGAFGIYNRSWLTTHKGVHWKFYSEVVIPPSKVLSHKEQINES